jgi:hypothetical protein
MDLCGDPHAPGHDVQVDGGRIVAPPGDVLIGADEQELRAPRVAGRRLAEGERDAAERRAGGQRRDGRGPAADGADRGEAAAEVIVERRAVGQPGVRQPGAGVGGRGEAGQVAGRAGAGGGLDDRRAGVGVAQHQAEAVEFRVLGALDGGGVGGQVAGQVAQVGRRAGDGLLDDAAAFGVVAGQQGGRRPALLDRGDLPGDVDACRQHSSMTVQSLSQEQQRPYAHVVSGRPQAPAPG